MGSSETPSLGRGAAIVTFWTAISRVTGFFRVVAVAGALGTTFLANTYNSANTAPNLIFELMAAGVLTSVFVPTFVEHLIKGNGSKGWEIGDVLASSALVALGAVSLAVGLAAPWLIRLLLIGVDPSVRDDAVSVGSDMLRLFAPQIVLYGAGMIMTAALHAHRRFTMAAVAPIFNNVVVIGTYLAYSAMRGSEAPDVGSITTSQLWVLGGGTTLGVVAMTACLVPSLARLGWRFRFRPNLRHPEVRRAARLGAWALSYAGGYQAGLIVVLIHANRIEGGFAAYQWAFTFFYLPHALFGVPIFNVLFTAMSEHVVAEEPSRVADRLRSGLGMLGFLLLPISIALVVLAQPLTEATLDYGVMTEEGARLVGRVLAAFAVGLPTYSAYLVFTRAFYSFGDTRTPAVINLVTVVCSSVVGVAAFFYAPEGWEVAGLAAGHSLGSIVGCALSLRELRGKIGPILERRVLSGLAACMVMAVTAGGLMVALRSATSGSSALWSLLISGASGAVLYLAIAASSRRPEVVRLAGVVRGLLGRGGVR